MGRVEPDAPQHPPETIDDAPPLDDDLYEPPADYQPPPQAFPPPQDPHLAPSASFPPPQDPHPAAAAAASFPPPQDHHAPAAAFPPPSPQDHHAPAAAFPPPQDYVEPQAFPPPQDHQSPAAFPPPQEFAAPQPFPPPSPQAAQHFQTTQQPDFQNIHHVQQQQPNIAFQNHNVQQQQQPNVAFQNHHVQQQQLNMAAMQMQQPGIPVGFAASPFNPPPTPFQTQPWSTELFDCMKNPQNAIITLFFPCVTFGQIAEIVDSGTTTCGTSGLIYSLIACCVAMPCLMSCSYRSKLRSKYGIIESPGPDWLIHCFCEYCALCQEYRELEKRGFDPTIGWMGNLAQQQQKQQFGMTPPMHQRMM